MNLLHLPPPHHVYFQLRKGDKSPCRSINVNKKEASLVLRMRRKSEESSTTTTVAARDRIISFGKYKGKMLGSLPSRYLKWVSSNLRAGDMEEWAKLADQVLQDPFYGDRIEWELALSVLSGDNLNISSTAPSPSAVSLLLDISDRFGWDNHDELGWSKVDFDLLGTTKGGRIPRRPLITTHAPLQHKDPHPPPSATVPNNNNNQSGTRRMQRRERQKTMRLRTLQSQEQQKKHDSNGDGEMARHHHNQYQNPIANPFPGREALLTRALTHNRHNKKGNFK